MKKLTLLFGLVLMSLSIQAQDLKIHVEPESLKLNVGESLRLKAEVVDQNNKKVDGRTVAYYSFSRRSVGVDSTGLLTAYKPGEHKVIVVSPGSDGNYIRKDLTVMIAYPDISKVVIEDIPSKIYAGTTFPLNVKVLDEMKSVRENVEVAMNSSDESVAQPDAFLNIIAGKPGNATITV